MINAVIHWSLRNRFMVMILAASLFVAGIWAVRTMPVDALPDLSDVQVIVKTRYPGQAPQVVEDQVTFPLTTALLSVPGAEAVRGYSFFGDSFVYVLFKDGTDLYWARSRVLEILNRLTARLPQAAVPELGPDATGVGWVFQYALVDRSGQHDLGELRAIQDWRVKLALQAVPGVAEVASLGGMVRAYQVVVDPNRLRGYGLTLERLRTAIATANQESGASIIEMAQAEYMVRATGYIQSEADLANIPLMTSPSGTPVLLKDVADIRRGPDLRRGVGELNGEGEVAGGIVVMRYGENAKATITAVRERLAKLQASLPSGVEIVTTYDRSALIDRAIDNLREKLTEESVVVILVCVAFLLHLRSSFVVIAMLPLAVFAAFLVMRLQGINANIMSLSGIAISIGAMVDAAIVMIENLHRKLAEEPSPRDRWETVGKAATEVGPSLFFSLLIVTVSFLPVFALEAQEGRMFAPLAFTKSYAMAGAAILSVTLVPVLMGYCVRGRIRREDENPLNRALQRVYRPALTLALAWPRMVIAGAAIVVLSAAIPIHLSGWEFIPDMDEGDLLYMPTLLPGASIGTATRILQQSDAAIKSIPEVLSVHGKLGRAETATDPAPLTMIETTVRLKPRSAWRPGLTTEKLKAELNDKLHFPGVPNVWVMPIRNRLDMLATGIKTPVGVKVIGPDLATIGHLTKQIETTLKTIPGTTSAYAERVVGGRYITLTVDRIRAARYGLSVGAFHAILAAAVGGDTVTETIEKRERYPVILRYAADWRDSLEALERLPIVTPQGAHIMLKDVTTIAITQGPDMIRSEDGQLSGWIFVDISGRDLGGYVMDAKKVVESQITLPPGYSVAWTGQFLYFERAMDRLELVIPATFLLIVLMLYTLFHRFGEVAIILSALPFALAGGAWFIYALGYHLSVAVFIGFISLSGVAVETAIIMLLYLKLAWERRQKDAAAADHPLTAGDLRDAIVEGALLRLRPKAMTVITIFAGLIPIMIGSGAGSEVMKRIAAPMIGGMVTTTLLTLVVVPAIYLLWQRNLITEEQPPS